MFVFFSTGNSLGFMNIYKNSELEPWRQCIGLGNIVATTIGDIFNDGQKSLVIISANGHLNVYQCKSEYEVSIHENSPGFNGIEKIFFFQPCDFTKF